MSEALEPFIPKRLHNESDESLLHRIKLFVSSEADRAVARHRQRIVQGSEDDLEIAAGVIEIWAFSEQIASDIESSGDEDNPSLHDAGAVDPEIAASYAAIMERVKAEDALLLTGNPEVVRDAIVSLCFAIILNESPADPDH